MICTMLLLNAHDESLMNQILDITAFVAVWVPRGRVQQGYASHVHKTIVPSRMFSESMCMLLILLFYYHYCRTIKCRPIRYRISRWTSVSWIRINRISVESTYKKL